MIVLDEPTSSIDVSIQAQVLNLLVDLQEMKKLTYMFISHDPNVARFMADYIAVMHLGKVVGTARCQPCFPHPNIRTLRRCWLCSEAWSELPSEAAKEGIRRA